MTQASRPQGEHITNMIALGYTTADSGPYSATQWAERVRHPTVGDASTLGIRGRIRGPVPSVWDKLGVVNYGAPSKTFRVYTGAAVCGGHVFFSNATVEFTPSNPAASPVNGRTDIIVVMENNTTTPYNTGIEFPDNAGDLVDYYTAAGLWYIPPHATRLVILTGPDDDSGNAPTLPATLTTQFAIPLFQYNISAAGAITVPVDLREFSLIEQIVGVIAADNATIKDGLIIGTEVDDAATRGAIGLGIGIKHQLEDDAGTLQDAGRIVTRWSAAATATRRARVEARAWEIAAEHIVMVLESPPTATPVVAGNARGAGAVDLTCQKLAAADVPSGVSSGTFAGAASQATGTYDVVIGGLQGQATGGASAVLSGNQNIAGGPKSAAMGSSGVTDKRCQFTQGGGYFSAPFAGDCQHSLLIVQDEITHSDAAFHELLLEGIAAARMTIATDTVWTFDVMVVGTEQGCARSYSYRLVGCIENDGGTTSFPTPPPAVVIYHEDDANFTARVTADNANDALVVEVQDTGTSGRTVRWVATVRLAEVTWPA